MGQNSARLNHQDATFELSLAANNCIRMHTATHNRHVRLVRSKQFGTCKF